MRDLNNRIQQLTKLILTSNTVDAAESRPASPMKVDFDMSPYQVSLRMLYCRDGGLTTLSSFNKNSLPRDIS